MSSAKNWLENWFSGKEENRLIERLKGEDEELAESVRKWCGEIRDQLDIMSSRNFEQYTGHGTGHSDAMLTCLNWLIPPDVIDKMNALELAILVLAVYHHDIGMAFDLGRKVVLMNDPEWLASKDVLIERFRRSPTVSDKSDSVLEQLAFVEWTRGRHAEESVKWIETERSSKSDYSLGQSYSCYPIWEDVKELCRTHTEPSCDELPTARCGPGLTGKLINLCFVGCALRLADQCHITVDRADEQMEKFIRFTDEFSRLKWRERQCVASVGPDPDHRLLVIHAKPPSSDFHRAVVSMGREIKDELEKTNTTLSRKKSPFRFLWLGVDYESQVETGSEYRYRDWEYNLNRSKVYDLLMGSKLYTDMSVCVRELLQNAVDAVWARWGNDAPTKGKITCRRYIKNVDGQEYEVLEVEDNGIGMDEGIIEDHLLKVPGESFYRTARFHREHSDAAKVMIPIAQHGIGFVSSFMVAKTIEIFTQYDSPGERAEPIHAELTSLDKGIVYHATPLSDFPEGVRHEMGTCVRLLLLGKMANWTRSDGFGKWSHLRNVVNYWARKIPIQISIVEEGRVFSNPSESVVPPYAILIHDDSAGIKGYIDMDTDYHSPEAKGIQVTVQGFCVQRHPFGKDNIGLWFPRGELDFSGKRDFILTVDRNDFSNLERSQTIARARTLLTEAAVKWIRQESIWVGNTKLRLRKLLYRSAVLGRDEDLRRLIIEKPLFRVRGEKRDQSIKDILEKETYFFIPIEPKFHEKVKSFRVVQEFSNWYLDLILSLRSKYPHLKTEELGETQNRGSFLVFKRRARYWHTYPLYLLNWLCDARLEFREGWPLLKLSPRNGISSTHGWSWVLDYEPQNKDWFVCSTDGDGYWINPYCAYTESILGHAGTIRWIELVHSQRRRLVWTYADSFLYPSDRLIIHYEMGGILDSIQKTVAELIKINDNIICPRDRVDYWVRRFVDEEEIDEHEIDRLLRFLYLDRSFLV